MIDNSMQIDNKPENLNLTEMDKGYYYEDKQRVLVE